MKPRAPFRYWGAKVTMAPWIVERLPEHDHFIEACAGSGAVMAVKEPVAFETLNDTYGEVVNFWQVLRDPDSADRLIDLVAFTPYALSEFSAALEYEGEDPIEKAFAFFVRMQMAVVPGRTGWSYCKTGSTGKKANKPGRWANMPELLTVTAQRFERVQITDWDILDLVERLDAPGVLIFVDPPYIEETRPGSTGVSSAYIEDQFDHKAFTESVKKTRHAIFVVSHYPHPLYDENFKVIDDFEGYRNTRNTDRRKAVERLYIRQN